MAVLDAQGKKKHIYSIKTDALKQKHQKRSLEVYIPKRSKI